MKVVCLGYYVQMFVYVTANTYRRLAFIMLFLLQYVVVLIYLCDKIEAI